MIGLIKGTVDLIRAPYAIIDTGGVGYKVLLPTHILSKIKLRDSVKIYTYTHVREDALDLFGFETYDDLLLFELFLTVPGVGPKTAIGIFAAGTSTEIKNAVTGSDISFFGQVPRLGRKNAQKIILELSGKMGEPDVTLDFSIYTEEKEITVTLKNLGFKSEEVTQALKEIRGQGRSITEKMKLALKHLGK